MSKQSKMELRELMSNAKKAGADICTDHFRAGGLIIKGKIGVLFSKTNTWHWFAVFKNGRTKEYDIYFDHSYNMANGYTNRGVRHGWGVINKLEKQGRMISVL